MTNLVPNSSEKSFFPRDAEGAQSIKTYEKYQKNPRAHKDKIGTPPPETVPSATTFGLSRLFGGRTL